MDSACYDSTDNLIIGVRGGRVYQCDPTSGAIINQSDYQQLGLGAATIVWDQGINRCFAACWNTGNFNTPASGSVRKFYRIVPTTLAVDLISDFVGTFAGAGLASADYEGGIASLRSVSGEIYGVGWTSAVDPRWCVLRFQANNPALNSFRNIGISGPTPSFAYVKVGGTNDVVFYASQGGSDVESWDFTASAFNSTAFDGTKGYVATEYAPVQGHLFVTRQFQFVDVYNATNPPTFISTINTGRADFNGVNVRFNANDGLIYIAGGADGTVISIDPSTSLFTVKTGFDLPYDFVFTPSVKFAVQQGSKPLLPFS